MATPNATLQAALDDGLAELQNHVYATRPNYYRDLSCQPSGSPLIADDGEGGKYMLGDLECQVLIP